MSGHGGGYGHDGVRERTFAALPPAPGMGFAQTWWGRAWLSALEDGALDGAQVRAGRRMARAGAVGAVSVRPGRVTAVVRDRDRTAHRADVLLDVLSDAQWNRFLDLAGRRSGHVAALLDREMPPHLVEDAETAGIDLLPGLGDLEAECDCGAWDHCGHTAAVCYQVARLLDQDPFVLLLLRGRPEGVLLSDLQARGVAAAAVSEPERADGVDADAPVPPGLDPAALELLAARTAVEARLMLAEALREDAGRSAAVTGRLTLAQDAVRLAAGVLGGLHPTDGPAAVVADRLAAGSGRDREQLALAVRAWTHGGTAALSVLEEEWTVEGEVLARACAALDSAWEEDERPVLAMRGNRWTAVGAACQLRLGQDGRWWPYREEGGRWAPAGDAAQDPATALATAWPDGEEALS
ncbi:SWF or SNF family helicase [Streptomyces sp. IBSBF 2806]|uniref:SWF or SNF family helicase n=1 Tax=Streptomyces sp. IBSBF 2806 TaxID=2903529 RepID=UPI002FDC5B67